LRQSSCGLFILLVVYLTTPSSLTSLGFLYGAARNVYYSLTSVPLKNISVATLELSISVLKET
jgi:hypothetical protein